MKKIVFLFVSFFAFSLFVHAEPTDAQIQAAAAALGVPAADLKRFVQSYQQRNTPSGAIKIDAEKLYAEYEANQLKSDGLYKGKTLQVTGKVDGVDKDYEGRYYLKLKTSAFFSFVYIYFLESELNKLVDLNSGQIVTIVGKCDGYNSIVVKITDAYLAK